MGRVRTKLQTTGRDRHHQVKNGITNRLFAKTDARFQEACIRAGVQPTKRQAAKFRRKEGSAYNSL